MPVTYLQGEFLTERGWRELAGPSFDTCWLDCPDEGWLRIWQEPGKEPLCVCLCPTHALRLEAGRWGSDYSGAPLPLETMATEWPWRLCSEVDVTAA